MVGNPPVDLAPETREGGGGEGGNREGNSIIDLVFLVQMKEKTKYMSESLKKDGEKKQ